MKKLKKGSRTHRKLSTRPERRGDHLPETPIQQDNGLLPTTSQQASDRFNALFKSISRSSHTAYQEIDVTKKKTFEETTQSVQETHPEQNSINQLADRLTITAEGI
ncbi:unnamed protein product [Alternaria burnsii]|nr:unnamed protein product [Alternaria burnsii]